MASSYVRRIISKRWSIALTLLSTLVLMLVGPSAPAQTTHQAVLSWAAPTDAVPGSTYNVYRASGACPASGLGALIFTKVNSTGITTLTYTDTGLAVGVYCYYATQVQNTVESVPSNTAGGTVRPNTVTIQIVIS